MTTYQGLPARLTRDIYVAFSQKDGHLFGGVSGWCITKKCLVLMYSMMTWQYIPLENIFYFQESTRDATAKVCEKDITTQGEIGKVMGFEL